MNIQQLKSLQDPEFLRVLNKMQSKLQDLQINIQKSSKNIFKIEDQVYIDKKIQELVHQNEQKQQKNNSIKRQLKEKSDLQENYEQKMRRMKSVIFELQKKNETTKQELDRKKMEIQVIIIYHYVSNLLR